MDKRIFICPLKMTIVLTFDSAYYGHTNGKIESKDENINSDVSVSIDCEKMEQNPLLKAFEPPKNLKLEEIKSVIVDTHDSDNNELVQEVLTNEEKNNDPIIQEVFESFQTNNQQLSRRTTQNSSSIDLIPNLFLYFSVVFFIFTIAYIAVVILIIELIGNNII
ncbi:hypothetical protein M153_2450003408 [Pseudoloma neurophilia]|uniref:Uncharacterized protein n=1 Tax=Pseudoloma neurophilia TaxID=146866 RepID=A0A0R0LYS9_9MICR|nr:hypothetical protein M153_2450003408 [Pseudoloma neurophilia]